VIFTGGKYGTGATTFMRQPFILWNGAILSFVNTQ
jgi:hypothetical protein